ncbi:MULTISPECIES: AmiS/UreI family transporter [unclassified Paracoccus (in: a-proteobacteria)]|uniref:AmiS/UreI family transporter n=1 Tax=unclassified Paracoccus (in: a-proteobacteria) TaxID=2688777 RepID=UPI0012B3A3C1|nr:MULTISPECIES: AmiS/UreI family transporter [unclassified Paracoccus (in: a-proteobacteria)]UXU75636.1 AmiS/UreI family transporter [Paracoccus sp. SMMA_5]UXU81541.1 AmiS/UreI family transporter [Paracoccus sp. SMMA_5_TC]
MLTGLVLFYVGAVLFLNGLWLMGRISDREIVVINLVTALVSGAVVLHDVFGAGADAASIRNGALGLLFATTYLWVAHNRLSGVDGRGLGWFSLFVAVTAVPVTLRALATATSLADYWMALNWAAWAVLWFLYFLLLALGRPILRPTAWFTLFCGILTGWLPGFLMLEGWL